MRKSAALFLFLLFLPLVSATQIETANQTYSASTVYQDHTPDKAFDRNLSTFWWSDNPAAGEWLQITFDSPVKANRIRLYHDDITVLVGNVEASDDNATWTVLDTFTHDQTNTWFVERFTNENTYTHYRLNFTQGDTFWVQIMEWELHNETPPSITIVSPLATTYQSENVSLEVTADREIDTWWYSLDGGTNTSFTPNTTLTSLSDGEHTVAVYANDTVGNTAQGSRTFSVSTTSTVPEFSTFAMLLAISAVAGMFLRRNHTS